MPWAVIRPASARSCSRSSATSAPSGTDPRPRSSRTSTSMTAAWSRLDPRGVRGRVATPGGVRAGPPARDREGRLGRDDLGGDRARPRGRTRSGRSGRHPAGSNARVVDFLPHWSGNPWPYLPRGELADPTTLRGLDDRVYRRDHDARERPVVSEEGMRVPRRVPGTSPRTSRDRVATSRRRGTRHLDRAGCRRPKCDATPVIRPFCAVARRASFGHDDRVSPTTHASTS